MNYGVISTHCGKPVILAGTGQQIAPRLRLYGPHPRRTGSPYLVSRHEISSDGQEIDLDTFGFATESSAVEFLRANL